MDREVCLQEDVLTMPTQPREILAYNIRACAEEVPISLNQLATDAGVSRTHLYAVLACSSAATVDWIDAVATALGVQGWELMVP